MSLTDLRKLKLLRPENEWTGRVPRSSVNGLAAVGTAGAGVGGCVLMVFGDGAALTWLGLMLFGAALVLFTVVNVAAIGGKRREDRIDPPSEDA